MQPPDYSADLVAFPKESFAVEPRNQFIIMENIAQEDCYYNAGDLSQRVRQGVLTNEDGINQKGYTELDSRSLLQGGSDCLCQSSLKPQEHFQETYQFLDEKQIKSQPDAFLSSNHSHLERNKDLKSDADRRSAVSMEHHDHTTIEKMFESIIRTMVDTKLSTSDSSLNDADQLVSIMGDNNSHNIDDEDKKEGVDCDFTKAMKSTDCDTRQEANHTTETYKLVDFRMSENLKTKSSRIHQCNIARASKKDSQETSYFYSAMPKTHDYEKQSSYSLLEEESFNTIDIQEETSSILSLFQGSTRGGRAINRDINSRKWTRAMSLSLERATNAAKRVINRVRARSLSPPKTRGALNLIINTGKTFMRKSKEAVFALGCLTYETDSDDTEMSDLDERLKGSTIFPREESSLEICYTENFTEPHSTGKDAKYKVTTEEELVTHEKEDMQPITSVSSLVEYFERIEQDITSKRNRLVKGDNFAKTHENNAPTNEENVCLSSSGLRENQIEDKELYMGVPLIEPDTTVLRSNWNSIIEEPEDELHKTQKETNSYEIPDIQIDDYDNQSIDIKLELDNEAKIFICDETVSDSINLGDQQSFKEITNLITKAQDSLLSLDEYSSEGIAIPNNIEETVDLKMSEFTIQKEIREMEDSLIQPPLESYRKERRKWCDVAPVLATEYCSHFSTKEGIDNSSERTLTPQKLAKEEESCSEEISSSECPNLAPPPNSPKSGFCVESAKVGTTISLFEIRSLLCSTSAHESEIDVDLNKIMGSRSAEARLECGNLHAEQESHPGGVHTKKSLNDADSKEKKYIDVFGKDRESYCTRLSANIFPTGGGQNPLQNTTPKIYKNVNMKSNCFTRSGNEDEAYIQESNFQTININKTFDTKSDSFVQSLAVERNSRPTSGSDSPRCLEELFSMQRTTFNDKNGLNIGSDADLNSLQEDKTFQEHVYRIRLIEDKQTKSEPVLYSDTENVGRNPGQKGMENSSSYWTLSKLSEEPTKLEAIDELPSPPSMSPYSSNQSVVFPLKRCQFEDNLLDATGSYGTISKGDEVNDTSSGSDSLSSHRESNRMDNSMPAFHPLCCEECNTDTCRTLHALASLQPCGSVEDAGQRYPDVVGNSSTSLPAITVEDCSRYEEDESEGMNSVKCHTTLEALPLSIQDTKKQRGIARSSFLRVSDPQTDLTDFVPRKDTQPKIANSKVTVEVSRKDAVVENYKNAEATNLTSTNKSALYSTSHNLEPDEPLKISEILKSGTFPISSTFENKSLAENVNLVNEVDIDNKHAECTPTSSSPSDPTEEPYRPQHYSEAKNPNGTTLPDIFGEDCDSEIRPCYNKQIRTSPRCIHWNLEPKEEEFSSDTVSLSTEEEDLYPDRCNSCLKPSANKHWQESQEICYQSRNCFQVHECTTDIVDDYDETFFDQKNNEMLVCTIDKPSTAPMHSENAGYFKNNTVAMKPNVTCYGMERKSLFCQPWCMNNHVYSPQILVNDVARRNLVPSLEHQLSTTNYTVRPISSQHNSVLDLSTGYSVDINVSPDKRQTNCQWGAESLVEKSQLKGLSENTTSLLTQGIKANIETERVNECNILSLNTSSTETTTEINHKVRNLNTSFPLQNLWKSFQQHSNLSPETRPKAETKRMNPFKNQRGEVETNIKKLLICRQSNLQSNTTQIVKSEENAVVESLSDKIEKSHKTLIKTLKLVERAQKRIDQCDALIDKSLTTLQKSSEVSKKCQWHLENVNRLLSQKTSERSAVKM